MSAPQADAQVTLSLPILRKGQHAGEQPVYRLQFMLNFVKGVDDLDVDGIFGPRPKRRSGTSSRTRTSPSTASWAGRPGRRYCGAGCCSPSPVSRAGRDPPGQPAFLA
jgi:hypothetical protein